MSKLSFRARALDATKPLPVYHSDEVPDLSEYNAINRTVPQMPTGMEKEEETEKHLQDVIQAQQTNSVKKKHVYIPTPDAAITVSEYEQTAKVVNRASQYVRVPGLGLEEEVPDYDLDSEDDEWLSAQSNERPLSPTHFERMMDKLEKGSGNTVLSEKEAQLLLRDDEDLVLAVYDYWLAKRLRLGRSLIPTVRNISKDGTSSSGNPYLAFRKRMEKMQTRKNRKNDETAYMQMLKLKRDLEKALSLAEMVKERENKKNVLAQNRMNVFKKRYILEDWSGSIMLSLRPVATRSATSKQTSTVSDDQWNSRTVLIKMDSSDEYDNVHQVGRHEVLVSSTGLKKKRKKKYYYPDATIETPIVPPTPDKDTSRELLSEKLEDDEPDGIFTFKRKPHVKYHRSRYPLGLWPWQLGYEPDVLPADEESELHNSIAWSHNKKYRFSRVTFPGQQFSGVARRRLGRGGRVLFDRIHYPDSPLLTQHSGTAMPVLNQVTTPSSSTSMLEPQVPPSVGTVSPSRKDSEEKGTPVITEKNVESDTPPNPPLHRLHFEARSPSPSSKFEYQSLPFIEHPDHNSPPGGMGFGDVPGNYQPISTSELRFGRLPSASDCREEALSFSALPTSQFALKPSTLDMGLSDQQHSLLMHRSGFDMMPEPYSWSWVQNARYNPLHLGSFKRTMDHGSGGGGGGTFSSSSSISGVHPHPTSAPSNYHSISGVPGGSSSGSSASSSLNQQVPGTSSSSSGSLETRDISRSSLSVTNSKTIILSNAPVSHVQQNTQPPNNLASMSKTNTPLPPPTTTPTSSKGTVATTANPPSQAQQQQQLALQRRALLGVNKPASNVLPSAANQRQDAAASQQQQAPTPSTKTVKKEDEKQLQDKMAAVAGESNKKTTMVQSSGRADSGASPPSGSRPLMGDQNSAESVAHTKEGESPSQRVSDAGTGSAAAEPMDVSPSTNKKQSDSTTSMSPVVDKTKSGNSRSLSSSSSTKLEDGESNKALGAWMMSKPADNILQLSRPRKRENDNEKDNEGLPKSKHRRTLFASADAALITSQFARQSMKKEETSASQPLTVTHALNSAVMGLSARNALSNVAAGLPISTSDISAATTAVAAVPHGITKLPLTVAATTPNLSVAQQNAAKLLSIESLQPLQQQQQRVQQQQSTMAAVNSIQDGVAHLVASAGQDKKTVVNAVSASGQAQALPASLAVRRSSTGTNGTNSYQEILHTERVKQALAGMNHNSLLNSAKNSLVPPMNKSSEVT